MKTRFYVICKSGRKCIQYADQASAIEHANGIGGKVVELPFTPQYTKQVRVSGKQSRWREFGVRHAACSRKQADLDGVKYYEIRQS